MSLLSLLRKEFHWSKRNVLLLIFLLIAIPVFFAWASVLYQDVLPRDVPVAVVPADQTVTEQELKTAKQSISGVTDPKIVQSSDEARRQLHRESVYGIVTIPSDMSTAGANVTVNLQVHGSIVPFRSPSRVITRIIEFQLDQVFESSVTVERNQIGDPAELSEFLYPPFLMVVTIFIAFTYVPYMLRREADVLDRVRVEASLESLVAAKLIYLTVLVCVPIFVFHLAAVYYGYDIASAHPLAVLSLLINFVFLATISTIVMVLTRFSGGGRFINLTAMLGLIAMSGLAFPIGFFSGIRTTVAQLIPTHYAMIIVRSAMLKDVDASLFLDWIGILSGLCLVAFLALKLSIVRYRRLS